MARAVRLLVLTIGLTLHGLNAILGQEGSKPRLDRFGDPLPVGAVARLGTVRFHRCGRAAYAPDGKTIATASRDEVTLWDAAASNKIRQLPLANRWSTDSLIFSHDGKKLTAIGSGGTLVEVFDLASFTKVVLTQSDAGGVGGDWSSAAAFSSDDKILCAATSKKLFLWDVASGKKLKEFPWRAREKDVDVRLIAFLEDGKVAATRGDKNMHLWDTQTGKLLHEVGLASGGDVVKFSRDGKMLAVSGHGHWMNIFSVATGKKLHSLHVSERVVSLAFSTDGKSLAAASNATTGSSSTEGDQVIQLWDLGNLAAPPVKFPAPGIDSVIFAPDGKTLAWGRLGTLCFMDRTTGKDLRPTASHRGPIKSLVYLPDGKRIVSASEDSTIRIWEAATGEPLSVLHGHGSDVFGLAVFPNGKLLASCGRDGTFRLWDIEQGKSLAVLNDEGGSVVAAAFSADGKRLASGGHRGMIFMRHPATGKVLEQFETHATSGLAFSPDGNTVAALGRHEKKLCLQDLVTKKAKEIPFEESGGSSLAYSRDGKHLAVAFDETLLLLDTATNSVLRRLPGHYNSRGCVVFSPDSRYLASVSDGYGSIANRSIRVFELATGTEIHTFKKDLPIFAAAFSPDGSKLAVGGEDATAEVLDLRNLTGKERREQLAQKELSTHWESLGAADAGKAYEARADLLHAPKSAVPFLAKRLQPAPAVDAKRVEALIKKLDSDAFRDRDEAHKELEQLGELVHAPLGKALAADPPPETRRRLKELLGNLDQLTSAQLRSVRAIEILERFGTPEAVRIIERLTQGNADGLATGESRTVIARMRQKNAPLPEIPKVQEPPVAENRPVPPPGPVLPDLDGDPMPAGAIARLGSARWRLANEPRRIIVSADGKTLAVVNSLSGVELLDSETGRSIERLKIGTFGWWFDLRMAVALSTDWRKVAALEAGERPGAAVAVLDRGKAAKVKIDYCRSKKAHPLVPEEVEGSGSFSSGAMEYLSAADFSPDGNTLVGSVRFEWHCSGGNVTKEIKETHLVAWNTSTGKEIWKSQAMAQAVSTILFAPDGKSLTVVDQAGISFWDAGTGKELRRWQSKAPLFSARYAPDRNWIATGSKDEVLLWEVATGKLGRRLALPGKEIKAIAFSRDGKLLAGGADKTIRFWDTLTGKAQGDCAAFPSPVEAVAFSSDGKTLISGHQQENALRRWDVAGRKPSGEINSPIAQVRMLSFSRDSRKLLASATGEDFYLWEAETGKPCPSPNKDDERLMTEWLASSGQSALLRCEEAFVAHFAMFLFGKIDRLDQVPGFLGSSVDGQRILVQTEKDKLPCLTVMKMPRDKGKDKDKGKDDIEREFVWKDGQEVSAALSPDGKTVAAAGKDVVSFFDVTTGRERRYQHPTNVKPELLFRTLSVKFAADGSRIALVGHGKVRVLAVKDGRRLAEFATTKGRHLTGLAFSPDGQTLLTTSFNDHVYVWEIATGQLVRRLEAATYLYSPDNRLLAGSAGALQILDLYSGRVIRECKAEGNGFGNFAFSPNSKLLASACTDTTIAVWPTAAAAASASKPLDGKNLALVLETGNAADAYEALGRMIVDPERALAFLERRLRAVPRVDAKHVQLLIADLASEQADRREAALKDLAQLGPLAEPALRAALSSEKALGSQRRIEKLLRELDEKQPAMTAEDVLHIRAIQALERIGTNRARQLLANLAQGAELNPRTRAAGEALGRMDGH